MNFLLTLDSNLVNDMIGSKVIQIREAEKNQKLLVSEYKMKYVAVFKSLVDDFCDFEENTWNFEDAEYNNLEDNLIYYLNNSCFYNTDTKKYDFMHDEYL